MNEPSTHPALDSVDKLKAKVKLLRNLLEEVYETSFIDDMISDYKKSDLDADEEHLIHLLILRQDIRKALNVSMTKKTAEEIYNCTGMKVDRSLKHNGSAVTAKHYDKAN